MPQLYLIRHGLAGEHGTYANDAERPLTDEGRKKTRRVAQRLATLDLKIGLILTSPLVRAKQTAEILQAEGVGDRLQEFAALAPGGSLQTWLNWWQEQSSDHPHPLALVGHQPDLGDWAEHLIWGEVREKLILKKAGVIGLELPESGSLLGHSCLFWLTPPKCLL